MRPASFITSITLHAMAMTALLWLPRLFPTPVVLAQADLSNPDKIAEPLFLRELPPLDVERSGSSEQKVSEPGTAVKAPRTSKATSQKPDYTAPQTIVSDIANPVNRIQTIMRPDLVTPPRLKFPLRLQSVVMLPSSAAPVLAPRPPDEPTQQTAPTLPSEQVPLTKATVETPVLTLTPKRGSVIRSKTTAARTVSPNLRALSGTQPNALKALVILNAVNVAPDPSVVVPEGELAGKFVVGPSREEAGPGKPSPLPTAATEHVSSPESGPVPLSSSGRSAEAGSGEPDAEHRNRELSALAKSGAGRGTGAPKSSSGIGAGGDNSGSSAPGISISGGMSGRSRATVSRALPPSPSYPLMIISGGSSGGASRDLGAFSRNETVYSVSIPMADAGGGPDWTMQYALLNPGQAGAGLLVPPLAQKKVAAAMKSRLSTEAGPVFVSAVIDENGKLQSLKSIRAQDARSEVALRALAQWEFLPAQLDGKPVASKILLGVAVIVVE
jgi:hypothetical protein